MKSYIINKAMMYFVRDNMNGMCPCDITNKCPCNNFLERDECKCGMYKKVSISIPDKLDNIRREIMSKGYDHFDDIVLDDLFQLANTIRGIEKND